jgi:hypothetical protein
MSWNFHNYFASRKDGLIGKLVLSEEEKNDLKSLRQLVRVRIKDVFDEAKVIAKDVKHEHLSLINTQSRVSKSKGTQYLSLQGQQQLANLLYSMDLDTLSEFSSLTPRFWTQGSFQYDTLNKPFQPGQEMDIDDGTYMPMTIFDTEPKIGHTFLILLVDTALKSLAAENDGWSFEAKRTCGRIKIANQKTHIDVPMYAIPKGDFIKKEVATKSRMFSSVANESLSAQDSIDDRESYLLDSKCVNLALREGDIKWMNSDPKIVEDWFLDSCKRIGPHLKKACRFMKAWRDAQWDVGGPTSISLMAATVNVLDSYAHESSDLGGVMKIVARHLPAQFSMGVESPDPTDEKPLFPPKSEHLARENDIMFKLNNLLPLLEEAQVSNTKPEALEILNSAFGQRVTNWQTIVGAVAAPAFTEEPSSRNEPEKIQKTMKSG